MRCYQINQVFLPVFAIFHVLLERSASNGMSRQCYSWLTQLRVGWTDKLVHSVRSKRITSRSQQFHKQWQLNTITSLHRLCCYIIINNVLVNDLYRIRPMPHTGLNWFRPVYDGLVLSLIYCSARDGSFCSNKNAQKKYTVTASYVPVKTAMKRLTTMKMNIKVKQ